MVVLLLCPQRVKLWKKNKLMKGLSNKGTTKDMSSINNFAKKKRVALNLKNWHEVKWFGLIAPRELVWFYEISTIVGYLMPNPIYTYILDIYDL